MEPELLEKIPRGYYCYTWIKGPTEKDHGKTKNCPFWSLSLEKEDQDNGYCSLLKIGDWHENSNGLLWDQIKLCGINMETEEEVQESKDNEELWEKIAELK